LQGRARCQRVRCAMRRRTCVNHCGRIGRRNDGIKTGRADSSRDKGAPFWRALSRGAACLLPWRCPVQGWRELVAGAGTEQENLSPR
jgi:hypothetical protein